MVAWKTQVGCGFDSVDDMWGFFNRKTNQLQGLWNQLHPIFFCDCIGMVMTVMTFLLVYQSRVSMGCRASERGRRENLRKPELLANEVWGRFFEGSFLLREATKKIFS